MFRVCVCLAVLLSGCAYSQQPSPRRTIIVKERRTCTTIAPQVVADLCMVRKYCTKNPEMTCAEAYYRLTHCARFDPAFNYKQLASIGYPTLMPASA